MAFDPWLSVRPALLQASFSSSRPGFQPAFQNSRSSNHPSHSLSVQFNNRKARPSRPSRSEGAMSPLSMASFHSTCMWRICRRASSGWSKFISHASRSSDNQVRVSFNIGSLLLEVCLVFFPNGHQPMAILGDIGSWSCPSANGLKRRVCETLSWGV